MAITTIKNGTLEYLLAEGIRVPHCFTTRLGGVSRGYLDSLNIGMNRGDEPENVVENFAILGQALGFSREDLVLTHQVHTDVVRVVTAADHRGLDHRDYPECDGLVTKEPGTALVIFTADCTPILLHDPVTGAVGACHAGWRSTAMDIAGKTVRKWWRNLAAILPISGQLSAPIWMPAVLKPMRMCPMPCWRPLAGMWKPGFALPTKSIM